MRLCLLIGLVLIGGAVPGHAQYAAFKSDDGILLISQRRGQYFSVDLPGGKIIPVGREEFTIAGEIKLCLHPACGGFVRGPINHGTHVRWLLQPECPRCGQRYVLGDT